MSETQLLPIKLPKTSSLLCWGIITLSIMSCLASPDYNIIIGFLILFFRGINTSEKQKILSRLQLQVLIISFIFDFFWILKYNSYWTHGDETSEIWRSLSFIHNFAFFLIVGEILLKIPLCLFLYKEFSENQGSIKDLVNFDYKPKSGE